METFYIEFSLTSDKMFVVGCFIFNSKITGNHLSAMLFPDPLGELTALPSPLAGLRGLLLKGAQGREKRDVERRKRGERKGRKREKGWEGTERERLSPE